MLSLKIFDLLFVEQIPCNTQARLPQRGFPVMETCEACGTMYFSHLNRIDGKKLAEVTMGNYYVNRRLNLRNKKRESTASAPEHTYDPQRRKVCLVSVDRCRRKVDPYSYYRTFKRRNLEIPFHSIHYWMETEPQGTARMERRKDAEESKRHVVMTWIGLAGMERKNTPIGNDAHFQLVYCGWEPPIILNNPSGVNLL